MHTYHRDGTLDDARRAAVVAIGDELIGGAVVDANSSAIAEALFGLGIEVERIVAGGDRREPLARLLYELCSTWPIVVATGGLGPTRDDVTRAAAAEAAGVPLLADPEVEERLRRFWRTRGREMPPANLRQTLFPAGAQRMPNSRGTADGFRVWIEGGMLACLPGPPHEMRPMLEGELIPWLERTCGRGEVVLARELHLIGITESGFAERAGNWMARDANPRMGVCAGEGILTVSLRARAGSQEAAGAMLEERSAELAARLGPDLYGVGESQADLARVVGDALRERGLTVATAESCTGGMVAARLVGVPGISEVFLEGWVTYGNRAKVERLGVDPAALAAHGAVSAEVAAQMAAGAAERSGARVAVSTTGIAGPDGGSPEKPVGLVCFGLCRDGELSTLERRFSAGGREYVRRCATNTALDLLRRNLPTGD